MGGRWRIKGRDEMSINSVAGVIIVFLYLFVVVIVEEEIKIWWKRRENRKERGY